MRRREISSFDGKELVAWLLTAVSSCSDSHKPHWNLQVSQVYVELHAHFERKQTTSFDGEELLNVES